MSARLSELADLAGIEYQGDGDCVITAVNTLSDATAGEISFLANHKYLSQLQNTNASAVILDPQIAAEFASANVLISENPYLSFAHIAKWFEDHDRGELPIGIHPSAVIGSECNIPDNCFIGANVSIGSYVTLGSGCRIEAGTVIADHVLLGENVHLYSNVTIYSHVTLGDNGIVHSGTVIGSDGFGFANDKGVWIKVPQRGGVRIGRDVEIGACTTIDCGAINDTIIEDGVKIDNLIQVAHNVFIGKNTAIAGQTGIAGSTTIGSHCTIAGGVGIVGHIEIGDYCHIAGMALVSKSLPDKSVASGAVPAMDHGIWSKSMVRLRQLDDMAKKIRKLEKQIESLSNGS